MDWTTRANRSSAWRRACSASCTLVMSRKILRNPCGGWPSRRRGMSEPLAQKRLPSRRCIHRSSPARSTPMAWSISFSRTRAARSSGEKSSRASWPGISTAGAPKMASAPGFHAVMRPSTSMVMRAKSRALSNTARNRASLWRRTSSLRARSTRAQTRVASSRIKVTSSSRQSCAAESYIPSRKRHWPSRTTGTVTNAPTPMAA